jgi:hypothetical protein
MREISNTTEPDSGSCSEIQDGYVAETNGWETEVTFRCKKVNYNLINYVNKRISLKSLFQKNKLYFEEKYSPSGWTHKRTCPFPDHNDKTPSFHYNTLEDRFYCFGCKRGGQAVQFLSYYKNISKISAAELLSESLGSVEDVCIDLENETKDNIDEILLEFSDVVREFIKKHKSYAAMMFAEKVTWGLDLYLLKHVSRASIDESNLVARLKLLKEKIDGYTE